MNFWISSLLTCHDNILLIYLVKMLHWKRGSGPLAITLYIYV